MHALVRISAAWGAPSWRVGLCRCRPARGRAATIEGKLYGMGIIVRRWGFPRGWDVWRPRGASSAAPAMDRRAAVPALAAAACLAPCVMWKVAPAAAGLRDAGASALEPLRRPQRTNQVDGQQLQLGLQRQHPGPEPEFELEPAISCDTCSEPGPRLPDVPPRPAMDPCLSAEWPMCTPSAPPRFGSDGFVILPQIVSPDLVSALNARLERVLRGDFDTGTPPDKRPKFNPEARVKKGKKPQALGGPSRRTLQIINIWKADTTFASVVRSPTLARFVARLGGWKGARVANDQVWAKPPGAAPITFHRDSTYFDFEPADVITVWLALDDMTEDLGTLEYVCGSHKWGNERRGSAQQFFDARDNRSLVFDAARKEGIDDPSNSLKLVQVGVKRGGGSVHNGRLWHGSGTHCVNPSRHFFVLLLCRNAFKLISGSMHFVTGSVGSTAMELDSGANCSKTLPRRGLGIHFVPAEARFRDDTSYIGKLWAPYKQPDSLELPEYAFPATWL